MTASGAAAGGASVGSHGWPDDPSPWVVVDRDDRVEVGGLRVSWTFWLIMGVILIPFVWFFGGGFDDDWFQGFGPVFVAFAAVSLFITRRDLTFLRADGEGLHLRTTFLRRTYVVHSWDEVVGFRASKAVSLLPIEEWHVVTASGASIRVLPLAVQRGARRYVVLRQIMGGVAQFPTRIGRPALPLDVTPEPGSAASTCLPPPPDPRA